MRRYIFAVLAYLVPTFALGFVWHLVLFQSYYDALGVYRRDIIIPFGFLSMLIQAAIFAWVYGKTFAPVRGTLLSGALRYGPGWRCAVVELYDIGGRGKERDGIGPGLSADRNRIHNCAVGARGAFDGGIRGSA
jgi:hypothetical protein